MTGFEIIPAIDILGGKCVRLTKGDYGSVEEFSSNPEDVAKRWEELGAKRLHVVDLDGAKVGYPINQKVISKLAQNVNAKVQVGGGIRTLDAVKEYFNLGISYIVLGTKAIQDGQFLKDLQELYKEKVILGLDIKNNKVALSGWCETIDVDMKALSCNVGNIKEIIYTDVSKDGTLSGPNIESIKDIASSFKSNIIVSGGISSLEDIGEIVKLKKLGFPNISGVILGKSLYKGRINLSFAIDLVAREFT